MPDKPDMYKLLKFADWVINQSFDGMYADGGDIQEQAEHYGLLKQVIVTAPCCDDCACAEYGEFPMHCYRKTYLNALDKEDARPQRGGWAPGNYFNRCIYCSEIFIGDKRACSCADCAYRNEPAAEKGNE